MINVTTGHSLVADIEVSSARIPEVGNSHNCDMTYADLTIGDKAIYDAGFGVLVIDTFCDVENTPYELQINRITSQPVNEADASLFEPMTKSIMDYLTMSVEEQAKLDALNQLFINHCW